MSGFLFYGEGHHAKGEPTPFGWVAVSFAVVLALVGTVMIFMMGIGWVNNSFLPARRLQRAEIEKRIQVEDAKAKEDSATHLAEAEVSRARGVATANEIIAGSITESYLRYLFVTGISDPHDEQIIYVPTEANLPILEAGKRWGSK